jgi:hypothetical protein
MCILHNFPIYRIRLRLELTPNFRFPERYEYYFLDVAQAWHEAHVYSENDTTNKDAFDLNYG